MAHHAHHASAQAHKARVWIVAVSSTRTVETDKGGPVIARLLEESGHTVVGREVLPDAAGTVRARLLALVDDSSVDAVVLTGGTGISTRDGTYEAVAGLLEKTLPGFGELFRVLSHREIGSAAMLSRAVGGVVRGLVVFAVPGSPAACELAARELIAPELGHLVYELGKETEAASADPLVNSPPVSGDAEAEEEGAAVEGGLHVSPVESSAPKMDPEAPLEGWFASLDGLGGELVRGQRVPLPEDLTGLAAANQVLESAGEQARVRLPHGDYAVLGWPDLRRPDAQVLLVGAGEIVALHRQPGQAGLVADARGGLLVHAGRLGRTAEELTGRDYPGDGRLFAVDGSVIYVRDGDRVSSWDGQRVMDLGTTSQATASLLLGWSQR